MSKKNKFLRFFLVVVIPIIILLTILSIAILFTLYQIKIDDLKTYKHVVIQRMAQYAESNFIGVNTLSITTEFVDEPKRRDEIQKIFNIITVNGRYPYMGVLRNEIPVVESFFGKIPSGHKFLSKWHPIQLKDVSNSFYRYFLLEDGRYIVELRKNLNDIATIAYVDFKPLFVLLTEKKANGGMELKVSFQEKVIFKSENYSNPSILVQDILFKDDQSQLVFHAQYNLMNFVIEYIMIYIEVIGFILFMFFFIVYSGYRSLIYLYGIVELKNTTNKKEKVKGLGYRLNKDIMVPQLVKKIVETLLNQDQQNDDILNNQLNLFHNLKNISQNLVFILNNINDISKLDNDLFLLIKNEISRINAKSTEGEQKARAIINNIDETQTSLIDLGLMALDQPFVTKYHGVTVNSNKFESSFYGRYVSASKMDLSIIIDCLYENAVNSVRKLSISSKKEIEIKVFGEQGFSCLGVCNHIEEGVDANDLVMRIKKKIETESDRWTTRPDNSGGQGLRSIAELVAKNNGKVIVKEDVGNRILIAVGFPRMTPPFWAVEELVFFKEDYVVAIDDDLIFINKLKHLFRNKKINFETFDKLQDGIERVKKLMAIGINVHLLCDQNFTNENETGIEAIKANKLEIISTIITSDTLSVERQCCDNGIGYLAKTRLTTEDFPIICIDANKIKFVNIDDDPLDISDHCLECKRFDSFIRMSNRIKKTTPIYMDYMLNADDIEFDDRIQWLKNHGFNNVILHSGSPTILKNEYGHLGHRIIENKDHLWKEFKEI